MPAMTSTKNNNDDRVGDQFLAGRPDDLAQFGDDLTHEQREPRRTIRFFGRCSICHSGSLTLVHSLPSHATLLVRASTVPVGRPISRAGGT